MPVYVIDTLKPKNGLDFPVVEAVDVAVEGYASLADAVTHFATDTAITAINAALDLKADKTTTASLQAQIDQIAQAAGTGTADTEIAQARIDSEGNSHTTLAERINFDNSQIYESMKNKLDIEYGKNIYNKNSPYKRTNAYVAAGSGVLSTLNNYQVVTISVKAGDKLSFNKTNAHVAFFSQYTDITTATVGARLGGYISGFSDSNEQGYTVPAGAVMMTYSEPVNNTNSQIEYGNSSTTYAAFESGIKAEHVIGLSSIIGDQDAAIDAVETGIEAANDNIDELETGIGVNFAENRFDKTTITNGKTFDSSGNVIDGTSSDNLSDYVDVTGRSFAIVGSYNSNRWTTLNTYIVAYDSSKEKLTTRQATGSKYTLPAGTKYIRFRFETAYTNYIMVITSDHVPTAYVPYGTETDYLYGVKQLISPVYNQIDTKLDIDHSKNIYDKNAENKRLNMYIAAGSGVLNALNGYQAVMLPVEGGQEISFNKSDAHVAFFSKYTDITEISAGSAISGYISGFANDAKQGYTVPENAVAMAYSEPINTANAQIEYGESSTSYVPYKEGLNADKIIGLPEFAETVTVGTGQDYTSLLEALKDSGAKHIKVLGGVYNVVDEYKAYYGNDFFENYTGYSDSDTDDFLKGLWLEDVTLEMDANAIVLYDYDGDNTTVGDQFSVFSVGKNIEMIGGQIRVENQMCRYMIHDDFKNWNTGSNIYRNIIFDGNVRSSAVIGGGCGRQNTYIVEGCVFLNNSRPYDISYHNNGNNGINFLDVHGCYGNAQCAFRWYGTGTDMTTCIAHDNHFGSIVCEAHTSAPHDIENMRMYAWNNEVSP